MKKWFGILIGMLFIMIVIARPNYAGEERVGASHSWVNPDGSHGVFGEAVTQPLSLSSGPYWVNPDSMSRTLRGTHEGRLDVPANAYWVNPDGIRGVGSKPMLNASTARIETSK